MFGARDKYLTMTRDTREGKHNPVVVQCDADLAGDKHTSRSRTGFVAHLFGNIVGWNSRLQPSVSLSTAESEYMALGTAAQFAVWYKGLITDFGIETALVEPITILSDNQSALKISDNVMQHKNSRHIHVRQHWIKEQISNGSIRAVYTRTNENVSDIFTKALPHVDFVRHRDSLLYGYRRNIRELTSQYKSSLSLLQVLDNAKEHAKKCSQCSTESTLCLMQVVERDETSVTTCSACSHFEYALNTEDTTADLPRPTCSLQDSTAPQ
jgi:hypothetical protein